MEVEIDHYEVLGLPSGEESSNLTDAEIAKAYRLKALELHPDKNRNDPNAHIKFQNLKSSYEILKDEKARKLFDDLLRIKREHRQRQSQYDVKRRKMMSDLEERERASFAPDPLTKARQEEERIAKKLREEIARIRAMHAGKNSGTSAKTETGGSRTTQFKGQGLDGERILKVTWEGEEYTAQRLKELFGEFGEVEDVVIRLRGGKKRAKSALVVMASKDAAVSAMGTVCGDLSNPLLVVPLNKTTVTAEPTEFGNATRGNDLDGDGVKVSGLVGVGYQAKEDSILKKLMKAAEKQK